MKSLILLLTAFVTMHCVSAQSKVKPGDLDGTWRMVIDIDQERIMAELEEDGDDGVWDRLIAKSVSGFVEGIVEMIEIEFRFLDNHKVEILTDVPMDDDHEIDYTTWEIDKHGALFIGDNDQVQINGDDDHIWLRKGDRLILYDPDGRELEELPVYLERID